MNESKYSWNHPIQLPLFRKEIVKVGIVGSRRRNSGIDKDIIFETVRKLKALYGDYLVIVSGGCKKGADLFAKKACLEFDIKLVEHFPDLNGAKTYNQIVKRYYERNLIVADDSDFVFAMVSSDRKGGTENTIKHAKKLGKNVELI